MRRPTKVKPVSSDANDYVFGFPIDPVGCATVAYWNAPPSGSDILRIDRDRGGSCFFHQFTVSTFGDGSQRVIGNRVFDPVAGIYKEDLYVFTQGSPTMGVWMKGSYQKENDLYTDTHHTYPNCTVSTTPV